MGVGVVIANADGSDSWGADYFGQVNRVFWLPSGERVGIAGGIRARVGVVPAEFLLSHGAGASGPWPCLDEDLRALEVFKGNPYAVSWSPRLDTLLAVQSDESVQVVDLAGYTVMVAAFDSEGLTGPPSWSADGGRLAFAANGGNDKEIFILDLASHSVVQLTDNEVDDYLPAWQP